MKKIFQKGIFEVATVVETVIGAFILVVVAVLAVRLVGRLEPASIFWRIMEALTIFWRGR